MNVDNAHKWLMIVNPKAHGGMLAQQWPGFAEQLSLRGVPVEVRSTRYRYHAVELVFAALRQGYRQVVAVGGDGTVSEVVNALFMQKEVPLEEVTMGVIPAGSGNDWGRMFGIPNDLSSAFQVLEDGHTLLQDVGCVEVMESGVKKQSFVVNGLGVGLDAAICRKCNQLKNRGKRGKFVYLRAGASALLRHRSKNVVVRVDGQEFYRGPMLSLAIGIGRYSGGGMLQTPRALPDDGLVDITLIRKASVLRVLKEFPKLYSGKVYRIVDKVLWGRGTTVSVVSEEADLVEADGELLGTTDVNFRLMPKALRVFVPLNMDQHLRSKEAGDDSAEDATILS